MKRNTRVVGAAASPFHGRRKPTSKRGTVPVTERALVQRLNRALRTEGMVLKKTKGMRALVDLGDWYRP
jgi:hypothetical protein